MRIKITPVAVQKIGYGFTEFTNFTIIPTLQNAGLLPVVEKRKGSFFSVRKWRTEKGNGKFLAEWFHISPWEVPNFRTSSEVGVERALGVWWSRWTRRAWKRA